MGHQCMTDHYDNLDNRQPLMGLSIAMVVLIIIGVIFILTLYAMVIVHTIPVKNIVLPLERQQFWEIEHCIDFLQILHPILDWSFRLVSIPS